MNILFQHAMDENPRVDSIDNVFKEAVDVASGTGNEGAPDELLYDLLSKFPEMVKNFTLEYKILFITAWNYSILEYDPIVVNKTGGK